MALYDAGQLTYRELDRASDLLSAGLADSLKGPIGPGRRWAWTTVSLAELKQIRGPGDDHQRRRARRDHGAFRDLLASRHELADRMVVRSLRQVGHGAPGRSVCHLRR